MDHHSETEATLHRLVEQLEAFYNQKFERPAAVTDWTELAAQAEALANRVEALAQENIELNRRHHELEHRCEAAEKERALLSSKTEQLTEQLDRFKRERAELGANRESIQTEILAVEGDQQAILSRSEEISMTLEEAITLAEGLKSPETEFETSTSEETTESMSDPEPTDSSNDHGPLQQEDAPAIRPLGIDALESTALRLSSEVNTLAEENEALRESISAAKTRMKAIIEASPVPQKEGAQ